MSFLARATRALRPLAHRRLASTLATQTTRKSYRSLAWGATFGVAVYLASSSNQVFFDSPVERKPITQDVEDDTVGNSCRCFSSYSCIMSLLYQSTRLHPLLSPKLCESLPTSSFRRCPLLALVSGLFRSWALRSIQLASMLTCPTQILG
jgi:hypothetical protein